MSITTNKSVRMAEEFQRIFALGMNDYNRTLLSFLRERKMVYPGCKVLDIGCGVGRHGTYFASLGCDVTLSDISPAMLEKARENMLPFASPWRTLLLDFRAAPANELPSPFDLVFSSMSPAVSTVEDAVKMSSISRGWCFVSNFVSWSQPIRDRFYSIMDMEPCSEMAGRVDISGLFEQMVASGFRAEMKTVPYIWCDRRTAEDAVESLLRRRGIDIGTARAVEEKAKAAVLSLCDEDGLFTDTVSTNVMWIYWKA